MHLSKFGGSLGTITGEPGLWAAWLLAATYIQWLNAWVVIGLPATSATESPGTPLPQPATAAPTTKKAHSAVITLRCFFTERRIVARTAKRRRRTPRAALRRPPAPRP